MNRFDRIFATALAGAALTLCVAANSIAANAESAPSAAAVAYSYTLEGTVIETQDDLTLVEDLAGVEWDAGDDDGPWELAEKAANHFGLSVYGKGG